jgi:hypothetical protein
VKAIDHLFLHNLANVSAEQLVDPASSGSIAGGPASTVVGQKSPVVASVAEDFAENHPYSKAFDKSMKSGLKNKKRKGEKKKFRNLCLKIIHFLDEKDEVRRADLISELLISYKEKEINEMIILLHKNNLIISSAGRFSSLSIASYS